MAYGLQHKIGELIEFSHTPAALDHDNPANASMFRDINILKRGIPLMKSTLALPDGGVDAVFSLQFAPKVVNDNALKGLNPEEYFKLVQDLVCKGVAYQKKAGVYAFQLSPLVIITDNSANTIETEKRIPFDHMLIFDGAKFTKDQAKDTFRFIFTNYGQMNSSTDLIGPDLMQAINNGELELTCRVKGYGIWTMSPKNFRKDYEMSGDGSYHVKEGTTRLCMDVADNFLMPVSWGTFGVRKGGTLAARTEDLPQIIAALDGVNSGKSTILEALYKPDDKGSYVAKFDIYGMDPNFRVDNYDPTPKPLPPESAAAAAAFKARVAAKPA